MNTIGIYIIVNKINGRVYVGKTEVGFNTRWQYHKCALHGGYHSNRHLQNAWNKYGEKSFKFLKLEYCHIEELNERERHHIAIYKARGLAYNLTDGGEGSLGLSPSIETREKLSLVRKGKNYRKGIKHTPESKIKMSIAMKGKTKSKESIAKRALSISKNWVIINPVGEEFIIRNLNDFCRQNKLNYSNMLGVANGRYKQCKGWKCQRIET